MHGKKHKVKATGGITFALALLRRDSLDDLADDFARARLVFGQNKECAPTIQTVAAGVNLIFL